MVCIGSQNAVDLFIVVWPGRRTVVVHESPLKIRRLEQHVVERQKQFNDVIRNARRCFLGQLLMVFKQYVGTDRQLETTFAQRIENWAIRRRSRQRNQQNVDI